MSENHEEITLDSYAASQKKSEGKSNSDKPRRGRLNKKFSGNKKTGGTTNNRRTGNNDNNRTGGVYYLLKNSIYNRNIFLFIRSELTLSFLILNSWFGLSYLRLFYSPEPTTLRALNGPNSLVIETRLPSPNSMILHFSKEIPIHRECFVKMSVE